MDLSRFTVGCASRASRRASRRPETTLDRYATFFMFLDTQAAISFFILPCLSCRSTAPTSLDTQATVSFFIHRPFRLSLSFVLDDFPFSLLLCGPQAFPNIFPTFGAILRLSLSAIVSRGPYKTPCDA